jgi:hypothetical protein
MNINPMGGNGQSGTQASKYIPGLPYGQGQATMAQQKGAPMAATPAPQTPDLGPVTPISAPTTRPNEPVTAGAAAGMGPGPEALTLPSVAGTQNDPDLEMVRRYFPVLEYWANQPDTSQATKDYVQYLRGII